MMKNVNPPLRTVFRYQQLSETRKEPLTEYFWETKQIPHVSVILPSMVNQNFRTRQMGSGKNFQKHQIIPEIQKRTLYYSFGGIVIV